MTPALESAAPGQLDDLAEFELDIQVTTDAAGTPHGAAARTAPRGL